jgi:hypothetical protein
MTKKQKTKPSTNVVDEAQIFEQDDCSLAPEVVVIFDEELQRFHDWLQAKGDDPKVVLTLRWIAEFEVFAEEDEEALIEVKALLKARDDPQAAMALKVITLVEETVEPDPMLKRFHDWLQAKGNDSTAVLARWWLAEFDKAQEEGCPQGRTPPPLH